MRQTIAVINEVDMTKILNHFVWDGCDPALAQALDLFHQRWGPYSIEARRYSIFRLVREIIDPAWFDLQRRFPALSTDRMSLAWSRLERMCLALKHDGGVPQEQGRKRAATMLTPHPGKVDGTYRLSEIARSRGFAELEVFLIVLARILNGCPGAPPLSCFDSLREMALACKSKNARQIFPSKARGEKVGLREINTRRANLRPCCKFCGKETELSVYLNANSNPEEVDANKRMRFSALYCASHKPKEAPSDVVGVALVRSDYLKVKRSEAQFGIEFNYLQRQSLGPSGTSWAKSGNKMVDDYIRHFIEFLRREGDLTDSRLRDEARLLVDNNISDQKKEILMRSATGESQFEIAVALGLTSRQAISKSLSKIRARYKFDSISLSMDKALSEQKDQEAKKIWDSFGEDEKSSFINFERQLTEPFVEKLNEV